MGMHILLVDDEYISNFINKKLIENINPAIHTTEYNDPVAAFEQLQLLKPDLIFLDINMPVMDGWAFLDKMVEENVNIKVIILTSSVNIVDCKRALQHRNVIGYIEKPATRSNIAPYISALSDAMV